MGEHAELTTCEQPTVESRCDEVGGISEITILPDGRVYVLGLSAAILDVLDRSGPWDGLSPARQRFLPAESKDEEREHPR